MAFNSKTYHRNRRLKQARAALEYGKALRDGTHELCKVMTPERIAQVVKIAADDARLYRNLAKLGC